MTMARDLPRRLMSRVKTRISVDQCRDQESVYAMLTTFIMVKVKFHFVPFKLDDYSNDAMTALRSCTEFPVVLSIHYARIARCFTVQLSDASKRMKV